MAETNERLDYWLTQVEEADLAVELAQMKESGDQKAIDDAFFQDLAFGTAGLPLYAGSEPPTKARERARCAGTDRPSPR